VVALLLGAGDTVAADLGIAVSITVSVAVAVPVAVAVSVAVSIAVSIAVAVAVAVSVPVSLSLAVAVAVSVSVAVAVTVTVGLRRGLVGRIIPVAGGVVRTGQRERKGQGNQVESTLLHPSIGEMIATKGKSTLSRFCANHESVQLRESSKLTNVDDPVTGRDRPAERGDPAAATERIHSMLFARRPWVARRGDTVDLVRVPSR